MVAAAVIGGAVIGAGASMASGAMQADAAGDAAELSAQAQREATAENRRQYDLTREDFAPFRETGVNALSRFAALYGVKRDGSTMSPEEIATSRAGFTATPGYDFRFNEGLRALDRSAAARGRLRGGGYGRELIRYGQGVGSGEFENYANRLAALSGVGQTATGSTAAAGQASSNAYGNIVMTGAQQQGNALMTAGTARASGYAGAANAAQGGVNNYLLYNMMGNRYLTPGQEMAAINGGWA